MNCNRHQKIGIALLAVPFLVMLLMIATNMRNLNHQEYRFAIEGYDPRDLLKGHYLIFRYKWPENTLDMFDDPSYPRTEHICACMEGNSETPQVRFDSCDKVHPRHEICVGAIDVSGGASSGGYQPSEELRRYFIPEEHAALLERMLRTGKHHFQVGVVPRGGGQAQLKMMYIDDVPLDEFLRTLPEEAPPE